MTDSELAALDAWLATADEAMRFDLLTLTTRTGLVARWTNADVTLTMPDGRSFSPAVYERDRLKWNADLQVDEMLLEIYVDSVDSFGGVPLLPFANRGGLDGASVMLEWAFFDVNGNLKGYDTRMKGNTGIADAGLGKIEVSVRSLVAGLQRLVPAEIYQPGCRNTIYDARCKLSPAALSVAGTVTAVVGSGLSIFDTGLTAAAGAFDLGAVTFTSGALAGEQRTVKAYAGGVLSVVLPWPVQPAIGDAFLVRPGCDGTRARCASYGNLSRRRAESHIPAPETVA
jgi:uncharacterized phage protein (TIGR02218 family)